MVCFVVEISKTLGIKKELGNTNLKKQGILIFHIALGNFSKSYACVPFVLHHPKFFTFTNSSSEAFLIISISLINHFFALQNPP